MTPTSSFAGPDDASRIRGRRLLEWLYRYGPWLLVALVFATRLPFMMQTLYAFDSGNYALAVRDYYNVAHHRPHPPGYPLYVGIAKAIDLLVRDPNRSLILEGILLSAVAVTATVALARDLFGRGTGLLAGLLLVFTVGFWGYGEVAYPYVGLAAETSVAAYLAHAVLGGRRAAVIPLGVALGLAAGIRWDGAVFGLPVWLWALWTVPWRLRAASIAAAVAVVAAWAIPMVVLSGGIEVYLTAISDYLRVWAPQSAYVVGSFESGQATQAGYNVSFFVNYSRQMLGVGLLLALYALVRRAGPAVLATDYRARFLLVWLVPPILTYLFTHLGEPGYVLSLAPVAATLAAVALVDLRGELERAFQVIRARFPRRPLPDPRLAAMTGAALLACAVLAWNVQAFTRGVGPGRLPDLRGGDARTSAQVEYLRGQPRERTLVLAHDTLRQLEFYLPGYPVKLQYSEYVPGWETARTTTELATGTEQVIVLDALTPSPGAREVVLRAEPRVTAWVLDTAGAPAIEHGYRYARVLR